MAYKDVTPPAGGKISITGGKLNVPDNPILPFIRGDGTGPDIWAASQRVFDAAVLKAHGGKMDLGDALWHREPKAARECRTVAHSNGLAAGAKRFGVRHSRAAFLTTSSSLPITPALAPSIHIAPIFSPLTRRSPATSITKNKPFRTPHD